MRDMEIPKDLIIICGRTPQDRHLEASLKKGEELGKHNLHIVLTWSHSVVKEKTIQESEATWMKQYMLDNFWYPEYLLHKEDRALHTLWNAYYSKKYIAETFKDIRNIERIHIIAPEFQMPRVKRSFQAFFKEEKNKLVYHKVETGRINNCREKANNALYDILSILPDSVLEKYAK